MTKKGPFSHTPPPATGLLSTPTTTNSYQKYKHSLRRYYHVYRVSQSASVSSSLPNSATRRRRAKKKKKKKKKKKPYFFLKKKRKRKKKTQRMIVYYVLDLSYFVQSIILRYLKKKEKRKQKKNCWKWWQVSNLGPLNYESRTLPLSYRNQPCCLTIYNMYLYPMWRLGPNDLWPMQSHNSHFNLKNLIKCIIKVVNVSKSQNYEFRHSIMNLGNQNSKYSWRIRDLKNSQAGTHFANSVLM